MTWTEVDGISQCKVGDYILQVNKASGTYWVWRAYRDWRFADSGRAYTRDEARGAATRYAETFA